MKFGEKVRILRNERKMSQTELGKMCGLSLRTIRNYEVDGRYPKQREVYAKLAAALKCEVNFLLSENEGFSLQAQQKTGYKGTKDVEELIADVSAFFTSGELSEKDKDSLMHALQEAYWMAKKRGKVHVEGIQKDSGK